MKIETEFDKILKDVYHMLALPYPPRPIESEEHHDIADYDEVDETTIEVIPFKPKFKSYNINKDSLTSHRAAKQLTRFISELERKRREDTNNSETYDDTYYLKYKENVVNFINHLSSRAKAEKAQTDSLEEEKLKNKKKVLLSDLRRFSNALQADQLEEQEQARRVTECHDHRGRRATIELVSQLGPIHEQLTYFFQEENACANDVVKKASSGDFESLYSSDSREKVQEISEKMEHILDSVEFDEEHDIPGPLEGIILKGAGKIGRTLKKGNDVFKSKLENAADNNRKKSNVHSELMVSLAKSAGKREQKAAGEEKKCKDKMSVVLDTMVHRVKGKEVEKLREEERKQEEFDRARRDTLMKIDDYGKRKEVLDNADTTYLTKTKHDAKSAKAKTNAMDEIAKGGGKQKLNKVAQPAKTANQPAGKQRRPTGNPPPGTFIKPVPLGKTGRQATSPNLTKKGATGGATAPFTRKPSAPNTGNTRKPSASTKPPGETVRKPSAPNTFTSNTGRKGLQQQGASKLSPSTIRKASEQQAAGKVSPSGTRKPSAPQPNSKVSPSGTRKPSAGGASRAPAGPASKWR